ncbi:MAG: PspC domain-containing protein [Cyclobacteriaceae bacterium]
MKKNISINISGIIFHIEEDGYDKLRKYLDSVNAYFSSFEDNSEILADIESRIAELFLSKLGEGKQVITKDDVSSLINTMGSVSDFKAAEEQENAGGTITSKSSKGEEERSSSQGTTSKKLYRDQKRKILGGVCSGLAHYFNIDPVWPRLLFALLVLGSYGGLLLVYIILWILLPASEELEEEGDVKKMFRDSEKKVIGGVASGVSVFFGIDVTLVRVLFVIFTIVGGIGSLTYIILWIALPEAKSITEKMQMQGEPVTLSGIESSVKKGLNEKDNGEESVLAKVILFPFRLIAMIINGLAKILGPIFSMSVDILRVGFGVLITMIGIIILFSLFFSAGAVLGVFSMGPELFWWNMDVKGLGLPIEAIRNTFPLWVLLIGFVTSLIPALFLTLLGISVIVKRVIFKPIVGWSLFVLFFICLAILSFKVPQTIYAFREEGTIRQEEQYPTDGKTLVFKANEVGLEDYDVSSLRIIGQDENNIRIVKRFEAQGPTRKAAIENAQMVTYNIAREDSIYTFDSNITFKNDASFRAQRINIDVYVPYNQDIVIDEYLWDLIDNYGRNYYRNYNQDDTWRMTESGLECITCEGSSSPSKIKSNSDLTDFESVELSGLFDVSIERGDNYSVEVVGSSSQKEHYTLYTANKTLVIDYDNEHKTFFWENSLFEDDKITINITMPHLRDLEAKGAGKLKFRNFKESDVEIKLTGAVIADGRLDVSTLDIDITGASFLDLEGRGTFMEAKITGASGLRAYQYEVDRAIIDANGASSAKVNVNESLEINQGFASNVSHRGDAKVTKNR